MNMDPEKTPDPQAAEAEAAEVIRKPVIPNVTLDDDQDDGSRSTKNDRGFSGNREPSGNVVEQESAPVLPVVTAPEEGDQPTVTRKPIVIEAEPEE